MAKDEVRAVRPRPHGRTGRFEAGVCIHGDGYGGYCASIYLRVFGDLTADEVLAYLVRRKDSERTFQLAAEKADSWARAVAWSRGRVPLHADGESGCSRTEGELREMHVSCSLMA